MGLCCLILEYFSHLVSSLFTEVRLGLDMSLITRIYYLLVPHQVITQEQIADRLKVCIFENDRLCSSVLSFSLSSPLFQREDMNYLQ